MHSRALPEFMPIDACCTVCTAVHPCRRSASTSEAELTDDSSSGSEMQCEAARPLRVYTHNPYQRVVFGNQPQCLDEEVVIVHEAACPIPPPPYVMCCYFKQKGSCRMGENCWHGHHGDAQTPCHYGAKCKAGHAHLSSGCAADSATAPVSLARSRRPAQETLVRAAEQQPCRLCGQYALVVQSIPFHEGVKVRRALRALCGSCKGAFLL